MRLCCYDTPLVAAVRSGRQGKSDLEAAARTQLRPDVAAQGFRELTTRSTTGPTATGLFSTIAPTSSLESRRRFSTSDAILVDSSAIDWISSARSSSEKRLLGRFSSRALPKIVVIGVRSSWAT